MTGVSAGLLLWRRAPSGVEVLLAHPGGPLWARKDEGAWSVPKGELEEGEQPLAAARREFAEELGLPAPDGAAVPLGEVRQRGGKRVYAFAVQADLDPAAIVPGEFELEWPPRSGRRVTFPEIDRVAWFSLDQAVRKLIGAQTGFLDCLVAAVAPPLS